MIYAEIAVAAPLEHLLTYTLSDVDTENPINGSPQPGLLIGRRVLVPLNNRKVTGYVISTDTKAPETKFTIRSTLKFLDPHPLFHKEIVPFFMWIAEYYHYPVGLVIKAALPGGLAVKSVKTLILKTSADELYSFFTTGLPAWAAELAEKKKLSQTLTAKIINSPDYKGTLSKLLKKEIVQLATVVESDAVSARREVCYAFADEAYFSTEQFEINEKSGIKTFQKLFSQQTGVVLKNSEAKVAYILDTLRASSQNDHIALKDIRQKYSGATKPLQSLCESGILVRSEKRVFRSPFGDQLPYYPPPEKLSKEQRVVCNTLIEALNTGKFAPFLLHGVTGSGKTEVYLKAAEETLRQGKDVLILVPEIGLATALEAHFTSRFGDLVVLQHSGLTRATRFDQFSLALTGKARVVIGARSAIFAPLRNPGLIVVDEEHDQGFKQDDSFRYNGRDLALVRGKYQNAVVVLGSATPSVTSYANAVAGKYRLLTMLRRIGEKNMPRVHLVDLNSKEAKQDGSILKKLLREKIEGNIEQGKQTILLINRRGFSNALLCRDCGTPVQCNHCHVSLTFHQEKKRLICHYCGFSIKNETFCNECRSTDLAPVGIGIERVETEVKELFPAAVVRRLDSDTVADRKKLHKILREMHQGEIDVLIGTQMVAKGHHFPDVTLVGVVWADGGMNIPDFRAAERTFQLLTQVTGRAGRGNFSGDVIIQTMRPDHYSITCAKNHDYSGLYEREMQVRKGPSFPPYVRITALHVKGPVESRVRQSSFAAANFCRKMKENQKLDIVVMGPAPSPLDKIKDNFRWQVLLKATSSEILKGMCAALKNSQAELLDRSCSLIIDVDPENLM